MAPDKHDDQITDWMRAQRTPGEPAFDADAAWTRFAAGHDVNVVPFRRRPRFYIPAAIAATLIVGFGISRLVKREPAFLETVTPNGQQTSVTLADGSQIPLGGGRRL